MTDQILDQLRATARRRRHAEAQRAHAQRETAFLLREARRQRIPVSRLIRATGLTRATIYTLVKRED